MLFYKKKYSKFYIILFLLMILVIFFYAYSNKVQKDKVAALEPITINLLTSVHPDLPWSFKSKKNLFLVNPGEVTTLEYIVENLSNKATTGIATFSYFPNSIGNYISKLNCFCYDAQTLKPKQKDDYSVVILIDPEVTKDSKTKQIKEVTIQFTFFDYKEYKKNKS